MIVGNGLLASIFDPTITRSQDPIIFASGVSNSGETRSECFAREAHLLDSYLAMQRPLFVYFSTCSVADPDRLATSYVQHKLAMEKKVMTQADRYLVLRLPQVVGHTRNPYTLTNFLAEKIRAIEEFPVWESAIRCLIDVEDVSRITEHLIEHDASASRLGELAPPETVTMDELVATLEETLNIKALYKRLPLGGGTIPDPTLAISVGKLLGIDFSPGYTRRLIQKYYGTSHAR